MNLYQFNSGTYPIVQTLSPKLPIFPHAYRLVEQSFGTKMASSKKFQFYV